MAFNKTWSEVQRHRKIKREKRNAKREKTLKALRKNNEETSPQK